MLLRSFKPRAILVSSMRRTRQTAGLIFPDAAAETYIECPLLNEAKPMEYIFKGSLLNRIDEFERWLAANDDLEGDIALVGHCQYLKHMLRTPQRLKNCDVYEAIFDESTFSARDDSRECPKEDARWTDVRFMLGSPLAVQHPMDRLLAELVEPALR